MFIWEQGGQFYLILGEGRPVGVGATSLEQAMSAWLQLVGYAGKV